MEGDLSSCWIDNVIPGEDESRLRPCRVHMGDHRLNMLAKDFEAAVLALEAWAIESQVERTSALFLWDDDAIKDGWERP